MENYIQNRYDFVFLFDVKDGNPNGDPDFDNIYERLKKLKWLLQFDHVKKVRMMKYAVRTFGLKGAMKLLSAYYDRK